MSAPGFDNEKYLSEQTEQILERVDRAEGKLYLEFGGKLTFDYHAARVLPGYDPNVKMRLLQGLKDQIEVVLCVYAADLEQGRIRLDKSKLIGKVTYHDPCQMARNGGIYEEPRNILRHL